MTKRELINGTLALVRAAGGDFPTSGRAATRTEVITELVAARQDSFDILLRSADIIGEAKTNEDYAKRRVGPIGFSPRKARVMISNKFRELSWSTQGTDVDDGFYKLECGMDENGVYIPALSAFYGEPKSLSAPVIYVKGRKLYGVTGTYCFWALPEQVIELTDDELTDMPDCFYVATKYLAARNVLIKQRSENERRMKFYTLKFIEYIGTAR